MGCLMRIQCDSCNTRYGLEKGHEPIAGRRFPCAVCQAGVLVPPLPWLEDEGAGALPGEPVDFVELACGGCQEEYRLTAADELGGKQFLCHVCSEVIDVPPEPWFAPGGGEDEHEEAVDFLDIGVSPRAAAKVAPPEAEGAVDSELLEFSEQSSAAAMVDSALPDEVFEEPATPLEEPAESPAESPATEEASEPVASEEGAGMRGRLAERREEEEGQADEAAARKRRALRWLIPALLLVALGLWASGGGVPGCTGGELGDSGETGSVAPPPMSAPEAAVESPPAPEGLRGDTIHRLGYEDLSDRVRVAREQEPLQDPALCAWGMYRLASQFGDVRAREALAAAVVAEGLADEPGPWAAAAVAGSLRLEGRQDAAWRVVTEGRALPGQDDTPLRWVKAELLVARGEREQALVEVEGLLREDPLWLDALLLRATLADPEAPREGWMPPLLEVAGSGADLDGAIRIAALLVERREYGALSEVLAGFIPILSVSDVAPSRRERLETVMISQAMMEGRLGVAGELARRWLERAPGDPVRVKTLGRLVAASGGDALPVLERGLKEATRSEHRLELLAEKTRYQLEAGRPEEALGTLKAMVGFGRGSGQGWTRYAKGLYGEAAGKLVAAERAYQRAASGSLPIPVAALALARLGPGKDAPDLKVLKHLAREGGAPAAAYFWARELLKADRGPEARGALLELVWTSPAVADPLAVMLTLARAQELSAEPERARRLVEALYEGRPRDPRPLQLLVEMARRQDDPAALRQWGDKILQLAVNTED